MTNRRTRVRAFEKGPRFHWIFCLFRSSLAPVSFCISLIPSCKGLPASHPIQFSSLLSWRSLTWRKVLADLFSNVVVLPISFRKRSASFSFFSFRFLFARGISSTFVEIFCWIPCNPLWYLFDVLVALLGHSERFSLFRLFPLVFFRPVFVFLFLNKTNPRSSRSPIAHQATILFWASSIENKQKNRS